MKYRLHPQYRLCTLEELEVLPEFAEEINSLEGKFVLYNETKPKIYLINESIYQFLSHFTEPQNIDNVKELYANQIDQKENDLEVILDKFFNNMVKAKILIPENQEVDLPIKENAFQVGDTINEYEIVSPIANKSSVDIYEVRKNNENTKAIKLVPRHKFENDKKFQRTVDLLEQEYQLIDSLSDIPEVIKVYDFQKNEDYAFMVMDFVDGVSWRKWLLQDYFENTLSERVQMINQLLGVFSNIHQKGILHGDVHSSNFIIENNSIRVFDFGIGKHQSPQENEIIRKGGVMEYLPPERIRQMVFQKITEVVDLPSEVYQLGVLIYYTLYQKMPFKGITWKQLSENIIENSPEWTVLPNEELLPKSIQNFLEKAMDKDPENRFPSATEMQNAWQEAIKKEAV